jgi:hypothetical protein
LLTPSFPSFKDERTKRVNETLQAIRIIKVQAWEEPCFERVKAAREEELNLMKKIRYLTGINGMFWYVLLVSPIFLSSSVVVLSLFPIFVS